MSSAPVARELLRAKDLADARYFERLTVRCVALAYGRPRNRTFREDSAAAAP